MSGVPLPDVFREEDEAAFRKPLAEGTSSSIEMSGVPDAFREEDEAAFGNTLVEQPHISINTSIVPCEACSGSCERQKGCSECALVSLPPPCNDPNLGRHGMEDAESIVKQGGSGENLKRNLMEILQIIKMETHFPKKIAWIDVASVKPVSLSRGFDIIGKLLKSDHRAITACDISRKTPIHSKEGGTRGSEETETDEEREVESDPEELDEDVVHPMDVVIALCNCCDNLLLQILIEKLFHCRLSIPLLFHDFEMDKSKFLLWSLRNIFVQVRNAEGRKKEVSIVDPPHTIVSFLRSSGKLSISKSQIINSLIDDTLGHPTFFHRNCENGTTERLISNGMIEAAWRLETSGDNNPSNRTFAVLNLRGNATEFPCQARWMCEESSLIFFMMELRENEQLKIPKILMTLPRNSKCCLIVCLITDKYQNAYNKKKEIDQFEEIIKQNNFKFVCNWLKQKKEIKNEKKMTSQIQSEINKYMDTNNGEKTITTLAEHALKYEFCLDENYPHTDVNDPFCKAVTLTDSIEKIFPEKRRAELLPLQGILWKELGDLKKEQNRCKLTKNVQAQLTAFKEKRVNIRKQQYGYLQQRSAFFERLLLMIQEDLTSTENQYIIQWMKILLKKLNLKTMFDYSTKQRIDRSSGLESSSNEQETIQYSSKSIQQMIEKKRSLILELTHIFREFGQWYEATEFCQSEQHQAITFHRTIKEMPSIIAKIILQGSPFELMDGDTALVPITWVTAVFKEIKKLVGDKKLMVLSVVGLQSSGKSTLLNLMFGLNFTVNAGRCTRGLYCVMIPVDRESGCSECDYILVIDTEGLRAAESDGGHIHDNELATMVIGLADVTVVNIKGENLEECKGILQIVVHALIRICRAKPGILKPSCVFVHQNVPAADAEEKLKDSRELLLRTLDEITAVAAAEEKENETIKQFKDVINYNAEYFSLYMPDLWRGQPPMAPINSHYCDKASGLAKQLIELSMPTSVTLSRFITRFRDLWDAIERENFVFNFRNHDQMISFHYLDKIFTDKRRVLNDLCLDLQIHCQRTLGVITETDSLRNMNTKLNNKIKKDFGSKHTASQECFRKEIDNSVYKDILVHWQTAYCTKLKDLYDAKRKQAIQNLNTVFEKTERKIQNSDHSSCKAKFKELAIQIAGQLRAQQSGLNENELLEHFDGEWSSWIGKHCSPYDEDLSETKILKAFEFELENHFSEQSTLFHDQMRKEPLDKRENYYNFDEFTLVINKSDLNIESPMDALKRLKGIWSRSDMEHEDFARILCQDIASTIQKYTTECLGSDFYPEQASNTIMKVRDFFEESEEKKGELGFTFKHEFRIKLTIHLCKCAINQFVVNKNYFEKINNPFAEIINGKSTFFDLFKLTYHNPTKEFFAASSVSTEIAQRIKQQIIGELGRLIVKIVKEESESCFENKQAFLNRILRDFGEKHSFGDFRKFMKSRLRLFEKRMHTYMDEIVLKTMEQGNAVKTRLEVVVEQETDKYLSTLVEFLSKLFGSAPFNNVGEFSDKYRILLTQFSTVDEMNQRNLEGIPEVSVFTENMQDITNYREFISLARDLVQSLRYGIVDSIKQLYDKRDKFTASFPFFKCDFGSIYFETLGRNWLNQIITGIAHTVSRHFRKPLAESFVFPTNTNPIELLVGQVFGCPHLCPFCSAPCSYSDDGHAGKHVAREHYPLGVVGLRLEESNELCTYNCQVAVASHTKFDLHELNLIRDDKAWGWFWKYIPVGAVFIEFSKYQQLFNNWDIKPDRDSEPSDYWKWFMSTYKDDLLRYFSRAENLNIPVAWTAITWAAAKQSLENKVDR